MHYYLIDTTETIRAVKVKRPILSKEEARELINSPVNFYFRVSWIIYIFNKIFPQKG